MSLSDDVISGMAPEDIGRLRQVEDPRVSPDGTVVAFTVVDVDLEANRYRRRIWVGSAQDGPAPRPFTAGPDDQLPRWSPDGQRLAFAVNPPEGPSELCIMPVAHGGERISVTSWPAAFSELAWSPDGAYLGFVARQPDPGRYGDGEERKTRDMPPRRVTRLYSRLDSQGWVVDRPLRVAVVAADGSSSPLVLSPGPFEAKGLAWSPDGARVAFASARHDSWDLDLAVDLWSVAADGSGPPERLTTTGPAYSVPAWSPDGTRLAYMYSGAPMDGPWHGRLGVLDLATGAQTELSADFDRNCHPYGYSRAPVWCGERLLFGVEEEGNLHLYSLVTGGDGKPEPVYDDEGWVSAWDWAGGTLAMARTTPTTWPELVVRELAAHGRGTSPPAQLQEEVPERRLTDLTAPFAARTALSAPVAFLARSADGTDVPCWAMAPVGAEPGRRYPTLINVHGGPFLSYGNRFFDEFQIQAGNGFGVLYCNPRGSCGYDEAWGRAVRWPECETDPGSGWGGVDFEDIMACVEEGCRRFHWADPELVGILGGSYGGFMTSWAIGHTDRFKAACSERAVNNIMTLEANSDIAGSFRSYVGHNHLEAPEAYQRHSPITYVQDMTTPVLILHSEDDLRCPISQAEELFVSLRLLGRAPVLVRFPGESHELSRAGAPRHRVQRAQLILDWFKEKLAAAP